jgi:hypothetical protein
MLQIGVRNAPLPLCRTLHRNDVVPEALVQAVREEFYPGRDFHRIFFGEIVAASADEDAAQRLRE